MAEPSQQEVIRVGEDGQPVYAEWDPSQAPPEPPAAPLAPVAPTPTRARQEADHWAAEVSRRIEQRMETLGVAAEHLKALQEMPDSVLVAGVEKWYSAAETARFFSRSNQWLYDRLKKHKFRYADGTEIQPHYEGDPIVERPRARFTLELIKEMAASCYRAGTVKMDELTLILRRVAQAEMGEIITGDEEDQ